MNRYRLEHFEENVNRLRRFLDLNAGKPLCAVFDIGTKATKLLVGPKTPPATNEAWRSSAFFNDGQLFALGSDHFEGGDGELNIAESGALDGVIFFLETYRTILQAGGVALHDMHAVGTAVFRWLKNQQQVVDHITRRARFELHVLQPDTEAFLSCLSIDHTYSFGGERQQRPQLGPDDVILLFDQGGGSTEVSFFKPGDRSVGELDSLHRFGTVALQEMFFNLHDGSERGERPDPAMNRRRISTQFERVNEYLAKVVSDWKGFPSLKRGKAKLHAYGMGTALSKLLGSGNVFSQHNRVVSVENMDATLAKYCQNLDNSNQQVRTLYKAFKDEQARGGKEISRLLVLLYGLPVYRQLLGKFGLDHLRFAGFGLRYGVYLAVCRGLAIEPRPLANVFLSHSSVENGLASQISDDLKKNGIGVWIDSHELDTGDLWVGKIQDGLEKSNYVAVILSKASVASPWVKEEVEAALAARKRLLPIKVEECDVPPFLQSRHHADFTPGYDQGFQALLKAIRRPADE